MVSLPQISVDVEDVDKCFVCGKNNPIGLKLNFQWDGKVARTEFISTELYQGWKGIVHGGIVSCLLDEAMFYAAFFEGMYCVTAETQARFKRPAPVGELLIITGYLTRKNRRMAEAKAAIHLKDGTLVAESTAMQIVSSLRWGDANSGEGR